VSLSGRQDSVCLEVMSIVFVQGILDSACERTIFSRLVAFTLNVLNCTKNRGPME
jgi:hypothetical protein